MNLQSQFLCALLATACVPAAALAESASASFDSGVVSGLPARNIGSAAMSGRISAIAAVAEAEGKITVYVGAASGGVWKSTDTGTTYKPLFDHQSVQSIGDIAVDPSNPQTVWVGTGESWMRNSVSVGDGIYKSTDGGENWTRMGLEDSEHITRIVVDPRRGDTVFACVPGRLWSDSAARGLYRTSDGGQTWTPILQGKNLSTGCASLSMDAKNPDVMFASLWDFRRKGWTFRSGGESEKAESGSGLFRSADGGRTWSEVTPDANAGFPAKPYGRIAVAIAPSNPQVVYAAVESPHSALYRSGDGGKTWEERDRSQFMVWRSFYFSALLVDPKNENRVFKAGGAMLGSVDGGKSFAQVGGFGSTHGDVHAMWVDPANTQVMLMGDDGGMWYSQDGGNRWWKGQNLPVSQFYHVSVDDADPYHVIGGLQDNSSWVGDSQYPGGITNSRWENMFVGDGFWAFFDPSDRDYVYAEYQGGHVGRVNRRTLEARNIQPTPRLHEKLRFNWNTPLALSPSQKGTIYIGSQFLHRSRDHGQSWERISPDLTTNDPEQQKQEESGGVVVDNSSAEMHDTIYSISESPRDGKLIWVGTDDGNLQLTRDGGKSWSNVVANVPGVPKGSWVSWVEASRFDAAVAYAAFDRHTFGDLDPYLFRTADYGKTWTRIASPAQGLRGYVHVIREDTVKPGLLFAGTELGLWISIDRGATWAQYKGSQFPAVAVRDLVVQPRQSDLVLATHGRGIWIIDDITPLRELSSELLAREASFVAARPVQQRLEAQGGWPEGSAAFSGENPPDAAVITYYLRTRHLFGKIKIEILDPSGKVIDAVPASKRRGLNRVIWPMRVPPPQVPVAAQIAGSSTQGPRVVPGHYRVRMTKAGQVYETPLDIGLDPRAKFTLAERRQNFDAAMRVEALFARMSALVDRINGLRGAAAARGAGLPADDALRRQLDDLGNKADELRRKIVATKEGGAITGELRLREHADEVFGALLTYEGQPTREQTERIGVLERELDEVARDFATLGGAPLADVNAALRARNLEPLTLPAPASAPAGSPAPSQSSAAPSPGPGQRRERD